MVPGSSTIFEVFAVAATTAMIAAIVAALVTAAMAAVVSAIIMTPAEGDEGGKRGAADKNFLDSVRIELDHRCLRYRCFNA